MSTESLNEDVKTRIPKRMKTSLEAVAKERHLKVSDIVREALREKLERSQSEKREEVAA